MKQILLLFIISLFLLSCSDDKAGCFSSSGDQDVITIPLSPEVDSIASSGRMRVYFIQDSLNEIEISGGSNVIKGIRCSENNNRLEISDENTCNWVRRLDRIPVVTVHYTSLRCFEAGNYYDNLFLEPHQGDSILIEYWNGSGKTTFVGDVDRAYFKINAGAGSIEGSGTADYCYIYHSGGGKINCSALYSTDALVSNGSNNDISISVSRSLFCDIRRTGNIFYSGEPSDITRVGLGPGQLIKQ
ncbi:hypothetical protein SDC9_53430 [bioreactor metagenome]|uniref:Putative auto-transporter adhesin head GIN domain-containing protein n=1 Tax=bioreactor metagenome TaxID=1076179 RepID=A0A644WYL4_9ZZZZ